MIIMRKTFVRNVKHPPPEMEADANLWTAVKVLLPTRDGGPGPRRPGR